MKTCNSCGHTLPITSFYKGKGKCKDCYKQRVLARYHSNKGEWIDRVRQWQDMNPEKRAAYQGKKDAVRRAGEGCIPEDFDIQETFPFYERARQRSRETGVPHEVDHVTPLCRGGLHCPSNLQVLTAEANQQKGMS